MNEKEVIIELMHMNALHEQLQEKEREANELRSNLSILHDKLAPITLIGKEFCDKCRGKQPIFLVKTNDDHITAICGTCRDKYVNKNHYNFCENCRCFTFAGEKTR